MRQYNRTLQIIAATLTCLTATSFTTAGTAYGEEPVYAATPPVTQSDGYGVVPYAPHTPTMVTRPASWPQGSLRQPSGVTAPIRMTIPGRAAPVQTAAPVRVAAPLQVPAPVQAAVSGQAATPGQTYRITVPQGQQSPAVVGGYNAAGAYAPAAGYNAGTGYNAGINRSAEASPAANHNPHVTGRPTDFPFSATAKIKPVSDATLLARVGSEVILTSDVMAQVVFRMLGESEEQIPDEYREKVLENFLKLSIETKLIYADLARSIPEEGLAAFTKQIQKSFAEDEEEGLPSLMKKVKVKTRAELEEKLRTLGSSLEAQKRLYVERTISRYWLSQEVKMKEPVTHEQMLAYYREHGTDFDHQARARWEQLTIRFSRHANKQEAFGLIAQAGNQVQRGVPFAEVAKKLSEGSTAEEGGQRDWITQGSLASEKLDAALFGLPPGQLSRIIEDDRGLHIVRVLEREEAYRTPFLKAQAEIKKNLNNGQFSERVSEYLARIKKETMIWTVYDDKKEQQKNIAKTPGTKTRR